MTTCIDLRQIAGNRYRLAHDPAYAAEHGERGRADDPWLLTIPCRYGHLYPHSASLLGFASNIRGNVSRGVAAIHGAEVVQEGDDGLNITFPPELSAKVAKIVKPHRKPRQTPEQRAASVERLAKFAFKPAAPRGETPQIPAKAAPVDTLAVQTHLEAAACP